MIKTITAACVVLGMLAGSASAAENTVPAVIVQANSDAGIFMARILEDNGGWRKGGLIRGSLKLDNGKPLLGARDDMRVDRQLHFCATHYEDFNEDRSRAEPGDCLARLEIFLLDMVADPQQRVTFLRGAN